MRDFDPGFLTETTSIAKTTTVGNVRTLNDLDSMAPGELLDLYDRVAALLPAMKLSDVNLAEELVLQFQRVKSLQAKVIESNSSAQQKAAVVNACGSALQHLVKLQTDLHNAERFKAIEGLMVKYMKRLPLDVATQFMDEYENLVVE